MVATTVKFYYHMNPVIVVSQHGWSAASVFSINQWTGRAKPIVGSCLATYAALRSAASEIIAFCDAASVHCDVGITEIVRQYRTAPFPFENCRFYMEFPPLHNEVVSFFANGKSVLDQVARLAWAQGIISNDPNGFRKSGHEPGGRLLNMLERNSAASSKDVADRLISLIKKEKDKWIDGFVAARDQIVHPDRGAAMLMFEVCFVLQQDSLVPHKILMPSVFNREIASYASECVQNIERFAKSYQDIIS